MLEGQIAVTVVGFVGGDALCTEAQRKTLVQILQQLQPLEIHHRGNDISDEEFSQIARETVPHLWEVVHPSDRHPKVSATLSPDYVESPLPISSCSRAIIEQCQLVIVCPETDSTSIETGAWNAVRYAQRLRRPLLLIKTDGTVRQCEPQRTART